MIDLATATGVKAISPSRDRGQIFMDAVARVSGGSGGSGKGGGLGDVIGSVAKVLPFFLGTGGRVNPFASGGGIDDRFDAVRDAIASGEFDPQGINSTTFDPSTEMTRAAAVPLPAARPDNAPQAASAMAYGRRTELANYLINSGAPHLMEKLAGQALHALAPRGLARIAGPAALGTGAAISAPAALPGLALASPRLMGEAAYGAGRALRALKPIRPALRVSRQTGQLNNAVNPFQRKDP